MVVRSAGDAVVSSGRGCCDYTVMDGCQHERQDGEASASASRGRRATNAGALDRGEAPSSRRQRA